MEDDVVGTQGHTCLSSWVARTDVVCPMGMSDPFGYASGAGGEQHVGRIVRLGVSSRQVRGSRQDEM